MPTKKKPKSKHKPSGRPSAYQESFCDEVISHMADGGSKASFAAKVGVHEDTVYEWIKVHPRFSESIKRGQAALETWFQELFQRMATGQLVRMKSKTTAPDGTERIEYEPTNGNAASAIFMAKNMINWRDKREISGPGGGPVPFADMSEAAIDRAIVDALKVLGKKIRE